MARRAIVDENTKHERWMVSYADFLTLLLAFFVVMYSISQVNESKYRVLSNTMTAAFNQPELSIDPMQVGQVAKSNPLNVIEMELTNLDDKLGEGLGTEKGKSSEEFQALSDELDLLFNDLIDKKLVSIKGNEEWLELELSAGLLFSTAEATLGQDAEIILNEIAQILYDHDRPVRVEGFTDNIPISTPQFPSNWELSASRSAAVVELFVESGLDPAKLAAVGYGEFQPKTENDTPQGRATNRRVVLMISKSNELRPKLLESPSEPKGQEIAADEPVAASNEQLDEPFPAVQSNEQIQGVKTVKLKSGGLLFTSGDRKVDNAEE